MDIQFITDSAPTSDSTAFLIRKDEKDKLKSCLPKPYGALFAAIVARGRFKGNAGDSLEATISDSDGHVRPLLLVSVGDGEAADYEQAGASVVAKLQMSGCESVAVISSKAAGKSADNLLAFALAAKVRRWTHDDYRTKQPDNEKPSLETMQIVSSAPKLAARWQGLSAVAEGVALTRWLVTEPPNNLYPQSFVEHCQHLAELGIAIEVLDEKQMAKKGMGALLGVGQGSAKPPRLLALRWNGGAKGDAPLVFIGKGVTFDTGGISLKPPAGMDMMKWDMGGAGAVAGALKALAGRKAKANVVGICVLAENMPDGNAQRPGDIVQSYSGQTVEVLNTDAEGRLILCDAMSWAQEVYKPKVMVDLATLTGAMVISLGDQYAGMFSNDDDLAEQLLSAAESSGDKLWRFPLAAAYDKLLDSPVADMKNIGPREAGSITAAQFLQRFVNEGVAWAHLDIAGMAWAEKDGRWGKGATGYGVLLLNRLVADMEGR